MLNKLWPLLIVFSIIIAFFSNKVDCVNNGIFSSAQSAIELAITLIGSISLWNGLMKILQKTSLMSYLNKIFNPIINVLFPSIKDDEKIKELIGMNMAGNFLGIGNAATPKGLEAMDLFKRQNNNEITDEMKMLILINTASIQLIPTNIIAIRQSMNSCNPTCILIPVWVATACAAFVGICFFRLFVKRKNKND